ncbi:MAG: hypothetical protein ASARMPREDX12_005206 [Alectoria sarmentosa]|nr:MAG: hypothetical protein ASARMPREDX12_005206 [Alectoria sarmentosa]
MSTTMPKGPELCIRVTRIRPRGAEIFIAAADKSEVAVRNVERLLLTGGASVLDVTPDGRTALQIALVEQNFKVVEFLLKAGSDASQEDHRRSSPHLILDYTRGGQEQTQEPIAFIATRCQHQCCQLKRRYCIVIRDLAELSQSRGNLAGAKDARSGELSQIDTMAVDIDGYTALDAAIWRRDCNEKWSNFILKAPDEDPLEWFAAFEAILDGIVERQERFYHEANTEDEDQEIWEDASESADACLV